MTVFDLLPCDGHGVTCDKIYRPRALMSREQAEAMLTIAAQHKKGAIPEEFMSEAFMVINGMK